MIAFPAPSLAAPSGDVFLPGDGCDSETVSFVAWSQVDPNDNTIHRLIFDSILVDAREGEETMTDITAVILAAGDSRRMGYPKALLPLGSGTFLSHILATLRGLGLSDIRVTLGIHEARIRPMLSREPVRVVINPRPERGQFSSMSLALEDLPPDCRGCLIWPVDQPLIPAELTLDLLALFLDSGADLAMPRCEGKAGHPAIFGMGLIEELRATPPEASPKPIVEKYKPRAAWLPTRDEWTIRDVDTPEDYLALTGETLSSALERQVLKQCGRDAM
jgi:molybdenum cofactor cytidylyltransferase